MNATGQIYIGLRRDRVPLTDQQIHELSAQIFIHQSRAQDIRNKGKPAITSAEMHERIADLLADWRDREIAQRN